ncbi:SMP-30/gluconolactonase/LRE family protein [Rhodococcus rhodochrous]|uniref:SMP-30/gluconolaconase/LRE-like region-containing protein n=1 Tax=Rhodococcus rhodochrous KG-21 TaxID=1441923 RepID=A0A0M9WMG7_RHORH|nr:SMP-30/gluconolactonase/LRE family protein [Rhodococcus rhodochrous]KOS54487.1 SMP-30/gluconolaconase/LRE-like region-containing protein [Rhodococcus rhodochrous KG-21]
MSTQEKSKSSLSLPEGAELIAEGIGFTEGPAKISDTSVAVTSINRGKIYEVPLDGSGPIPLCETGGGPNGIALGQDGELWITQNGGTAMPSRSPLHAIPSLQRWKNGALTVELTDTVTAPSDCVIGPDGRLWFTDTAEHAVGEAVKPGRLHAYDPTTRHCETQLDGLMFPNGLAFDGNRERLYVAETATDTVRRYNVSSSGCSPDGWEVTLGNGRPDGMAIDSVGWLWIAGSSGDNVVAIDDNGVVRYELTFGTEVLVTSVCFAGADLDRLIVTIAKGGSVVSLPAVHPGLPLPVTAL